MTYEDYSAPPGEPMTKRFIRRHRLQKKDPSAAVSERSSRSCTTSTTARRSPSARRCSTARAGGTRRSRRRATVTRSASRSCPRHESARHSLQRDQLGAPLHAGLEHGASVTDPRTGRDHQGRRDARLAARGGRTTSSPRAAAQPVREGTETPTRAARVGARAHPAALGARDRATRSGIGHNYYNSERGRISVMDYPHPLVTLRPDGSIDYSEVYASADRRVGQDRDPLRVQDFPDRR
jgi:hypothetical protein